jgi:radical SAM protein with 4Fe4S-binding SPASM domain
MNLYRWSKRDRRCQAGHRMYAMDPEGYIRPCVMYSENAAIFDNLATRTPEEYSGRHFPVPERR